MRPWKNGSTISLTWGKKSPSGSIDYGPGPVSCPVSNLGTAGPNMGQATEGRKGRRRVRQLLRAIKIKDPLQAGNAQDKNQDAGSDAKRAGAKYAVRRSLWSRGRDGLGHRWPNCFGACQWLCFWRNGGRDRSCYVVCLGLRVRKYPIVRSTKLKKTCGIRVAGVEGPKYGTRSAMLATKPRTTSTLP